MKRIFSNPLSYNFFTCQGERSYSDVREFAGWEEFLPVMGPLHVELGSGKDDSILRRAKAFGNTRFIAIEAIAKFLRQVVLKLMQNPLPNICLLQMDAWLALKHFFQSQSMDVCYMNFPDPWPKQRHHERRVFQHTCLDMICDRLKVGGTLQIKSDVPAVLDMAMRELSYFDCLKGPPSGVLQEMPGSLFDTLYEKKFRQVKKPIYGAVWTKQWHNIERIPTFFERIGYV